ncbi:peptidase [Jeongeupia sp. HS-3]|uniref:TolC family outer membrane protein n=1 Tax=Jeongeupia sp. HS-3 TaxID=1009682 RepID=UPI0018A42FEA|nr:TolC family outer membrane protein [Jeongeupia sp. HS-3]BCL74569.1 peptidase [Jeongeupia sp. HS-3]
MRAAKLILAMVCTVPLAQAMDLKEAWQQLKSQGPVYQAAMYEREAGVLNRQLGLAGLLPQISVTAYKNRVDGHSDQPDVLGRTRENKLDYDAQGAVAQLRQPLFNWQKYAEYRQGEQRAQYSEAVFDARAQDLAIRLANRYFDVLLARESVSLAEAKARAFEVQRSAAMRRHALGDGTVTDVDEATARRDLAQAEYIEAQDKLLIARRLLQEMLGESLTSVASLNPDRFETPQIEPRTLPDWMALAETENPWIRARRRALAVADEEVSRSTGGHLPTLDLVLSYNAGDSETISTLDQRNRYGLIGVQLSIPVFSGGAISAQVRQAQANRAKTQAELHAAREEVISDTTREFRGVQSGEARIRALETAIISSERALHSTRKGFMAGTSTNVDILNAEEKVFVARRDLVDAKLRYLMARLRLAAAAGALGDDDLGWANGYLTGTLALGP